MPLAPQAPGSILKPDCITSLLSVGARPLPPPRFHPLDCLWPWPFSRGTPLPWSALVGSGRLRAHLPRQQVRSMCEEKQSGARGISPGPDPGPGARVAPKPRLGNRKPSPHPASSPTAGTRPRNRGKGNLVFSCFALNPFLSRSSGQPLGAPHPAPTPAPAARSGASQPPAPHLHLGCGGPSPPAHGAPDAQTDPPAPPLRPPRVPCTRGAHGPVPCPRRALTAPPPPRPPPARL